MCPLRAIAPAFALAEAKKSSIRSGGGEPAVPVRGLTRVVESFGPKTHGSTVRLATRTTRSGDSMRTSSRASGWARTSFTTEANGARVSYRLLAATMMMTGKESAERFCWN